MALDRVLITGANGQLGRAFRKVWPEAMFFDKLRLNLQLPPEEIRRKVEPFAPDLIINCAAWTDVDGAEIPANYEAVLRANSLAVEALALTAAMCGSRFIHISTDYVLADVMGEDGYLPKAESTPLAPQSVYALTKRVGDHMTREWAGTVIRTSAVFGDGRNFVETMLRLGRENGKVEVVSDQVIRPTYAEDLAGWIKLLATSSQPLPAVIHLQNNGRSLSWASFAREIFNLADMKVAIEDVTSEEWQQAQAPRPIAQRPAFSVFDMTLAESLGLTPRHWSYALNEYIETALAAS